MLLCLRRQVMVTMSEHSEQAVVIQWARLMGIEWLYANINGVSLESEYNAKGKRYSKVANKMKAEGMLSGIPDLIAPYARGGYHGLYIEMKVDDNQPTKDQKRFIAFALAEGYLAVVCWGAGQAVKAIKEYFGEEAASWPDL